LFSGLLKQVNIVVEGKTKRAIFAPFSVSVIFFSGWPKILKQKSLSSPLDFCFLVSENSETQNSEKKRKKIQ